MQNDLRFKIRQLNSPFDDSAFFLRNVYRKRAMLLDCGRLGGLNHTELLSVGDIFVSHTHMDHFYGFDRVLRGSLVADHELTVYGPEGFINNVDGKFRGYTWNLVEDYTFSVKAVELHADGRHIVARFAPANKFVPVIEALDLAVKKLPPGMQAVNGLPVLDIGDEFLLEYEFFDHRVPSVGYRISEPTHYSVNSDKLATFGEKTGPWLGQLIKALKAEEYSLPINVNGKEYTATELQSLLIELKPPQVITYITDCAPTAENTEKAISFARGSTLLIIEAVFLPEDREHAEYKKHLTLDISKKIFFESNSEAVRFTHFSTRYELEKQAFFAKIYEGMGNKVCGKNTL